MSKTKKKEPIDCITKTIWRQEDLDMYKQQSCEHLGLYLQGLASISKRQKQQKPVAGHTYTINNIISELKINLKIKEN